MNFMLQPMSGLRSALNPKPSKPCTCTVEFGFRVKGSVFRVKGLGFSIDGESDGKEAVPGRM